MPVRVCLPNRLSLSTLGTNGRRGITWSRARKMSETVRRQKALLAIAKDDAGAGVPAESLIFINAWNEWAEGNHLEPCQKWGRKYLEATKRALGVAAAQQSVEYASR